MRTASVNSEESLVLLRVSFLNALQKRGEKLTRAQFRGSIGARNIFSREHHIGVLLRARTRYHAQRSPTRNLALTDIQIIAQMLTAFGKSQLDVCCEDKIKEDAIYG
ncbi:hypothetical protein GOP47_0025644 [Adiantum capillus-veneris]|uniref:Uncharacterized protein n=1 Tax=Adiantum capillus-veneris TaxID=13818 RepID=A0A9D4U1S1_ADICA|nr:hypothetical protein GOP47_0025644 [Adiantum capillus-veneris]